MFASIDNTMWLAIMGVLLVFGISGVMTFQSLAQQHDSVEINGTSVKTIDALNDTLGRLSRLGG